MIARKSKKANNKDGSTKPSKITTFEAPSKGFDPLTAPDKVLLHHGFPPRPTVPMFRKLWETHFARKLNYVVPTFKAFDSGHDRRNQRIAEISNSDTSNNWSGVILNNPGTSGPLVWVMGRWNVPNPYPSTKLPDSENYLSAAWVGLDGNGTPGLLQAGTDHSAFWQKGKIVRDVYAWWQWYPDAQHTIDNLPISPGDTIHCVICANSTHDATIRMQNISTGDYVSFNVSSKTDFLGKTAEWIVERPAILLKPAKLAKYGAVYFDSAYAYTERGEAFNAGAGGTLTMTDEAGHPISIPTLETLNVIKVEYL